MQQWWNVDWQVKTEDTHSQDALLNITVKYHLAPYTLTSYKVQMVSALLEHSVCLVLKTCNYFIK